MIVQANPERAELISIKFFNYVLARSHLDDECESVPSILVEGTE